MTTEQPPKKIAAIVTAFLFGMYAIIAGMVIAFGVSMDDLSDMVVFRLSAVLFIFPTFCGLLICRRFWSAPDLAWLASIALPALAGLSSLERPSVSQLAWMEVPILVTGVFSIAFLRWREKRAKARNASQ